MHECMLIFNEPEITIRRIMLDGMIGNVDWFMKLKFNSNIYIFGNNKKVLLDLQLDISYSEAV